jgi:hypothetical protein
MPARAEKKTTNSEETTMKTISKLDNAHRISAAFGMVAKAKAQTAAARNLAAQLEAELALARLFQRQHRNAPRFAA